MRYSNRSSWLLLATAFMFSVSVDANAYLDPGTSSLVTQAIIAGALGLLYSVKVFWGSITRIFTRAPKNDGNAD